MNRNNISWVDNKVFNPGTQSRPSQTAPQTQPFMDTMPAQSQPMPSPPVQTGVSPSTYQAPAGGMPSQSGVSPSTFQAPMGGMPGQSGVSPSTFQAPVTNTPGQSGVSPSTFQAPVTNTPGQSGVSPSTYQEPSKTQEPMGLSPATYQEPMTRSQGQMGVSPSTYQSDMTMDPARMGVSMPVRQAPGMEGSLTRTDTQAQNPFNVQGPPTVFSPGYTPAYLKTQIGKRVRAEFNIGTNLYMDRTGILREVGVSYFVLEDNVTHAMVMCDLYSLKFLTSV